jgi:GTPase SAR1 family protein
VGDVFLHISIWDTSGSEKYRALAPIYYHGARAAILVFDVTRVDARAEAAEWARELRAHCGSDAVHNKYSMAFWSVG